MEEFYTGELHVVDFPAEVVENVVVADARRRRGVGRQLTDAAAQLAESTGCYKIQLLAADGHEAHTFHQACGYQPLAHGFRRCPGQGQPSRAPMAG
ncbi:GNAT family N-acetyltransferase [Streptomyces sp. NPDC057539]|uniref:GNAT family N-acetyltransferase n=1 Tax=Streptomyces sp. NPDC057539 TaxID=3346159 RepID=UPI00369F7330